MTEQQKFEVLIPEGLRQDVKLRIASDIILHIRKRTKSNANNAGNSFPDYTEEYAKKKGSTHVDLTLTNEMLSKLQLLRARKDRLVLGYKKGDKINGKVEGNQIGSYGKTANKEKARPFLDFKGAEKRERAQIIKKAISGS